MPAAGCAVTAQRTERLSDVRSAVQISLAQSVKRRPAGEDDEVHHDVGQQHAHAHIPGGVPQLVIAGATTLPDKNATSSHLLFNVILVCQKNLYVEMVVPRMPTSVVG
jgi:hypothetical protein